MKGRALAFGLLCGVAVLVLAALVATGGASPDPSGAATVAVEDADEGDEGDEGELSSPGEQRTVAPRRAERVGSVVPEVPQEVRLPGTEWLRVTDVGTRGNGLLDVPPDVRQIGWWEGGSRIGDPFGSILMAGHVDSATQGLGPSSVLLTAQEGDQVVVRTPSRTTTYDVRSRQLVPLDDLAAYPRVLSARGPARLMLVTCAPPFLPGQGGYQNLAVVEARPSAAGGSR